MERRRTWTAHAELRGWKAPKFDEAEQAQLLELLRDGQPWTSQEIQRLLNEEFDVEYHPVYVGKFLDNPRLSRAIPRTKRLSRPDDAEEIVDERVADALDNNATDEPHNKRDGDAEDGWVVDDICTDGGTVLGFFDASHPHRSTIPSGCGTSTIPISSDRW